MEPRPQPAGLLTLTDRLLEAAGWLALLATWGLTLANYGALPDTIPVHFNGAGQPDGYGDKPTILVLPFLATVLFGGLTALVRRPHALNYPVRITPANAPRQYANATRLLRYLKSALVVVFGLIVLQTIQTAKGQTNGLGVWFLPVSLGLLFGPMGYFLVRSLRLRDPMR